MVTRAAARTRIRTHRTPSGWFVTAAECVDGVARVSLTGGVAEVVVADSTCHGSPDADCFVAAACTPEGDALLMSRQCPPALLVTRDGKRCTPLAPLDRELLRLQPADRLLILSPALFEDMPEVLGRTLHATPTELLAAEPATLLSEIFEDVATGAGVIIGRAAQPIHHRGGLR